ncbi:hypothetical protein SSOG_04026 [Streptomyces himastatinicus ATCC 53653]|uniref:Luciferase-like domain-containing protein n=1 Tax=Streptomyces himastatinicus ATCC 53653 TaxID=457427 RepID=D9WU77_9ACTN|nr:hypothetical protein SSOG_04026 [Streptomyces himastatinicus ATCC 53653]
MRIGLLLNAFGTHLDTVADEAREAVRTGLTTGWLAEQGGWDALTTAAAIGPQVPGLAWGTSVVPTYRSWGLSRGESAQPHAPNGLGRTGPRRTQPRGSDTHPVRGPSPGGRLPHDLAICARPEATGRPRTITPVERGPRTLAPYPASQIARSP